ncbi:uncharacterized protein LOC129542857 isoform X2 [Moschus berezovskii]|uniref:uncharacterized protein LOC129542857 isoform X2 n=1 Tax=Moschus berezovskii TaxID=68408 RepID=UPI002444F29F|nr:uncharacterized protein LOC129542857 isoform X2 [Moschus berezovskii]
MLSALAPMGRPHPPKGPGPLLDSGVAPSPGPRQGGCGSVTTDPVVSAHRPKVVPRVAPWALTGLLKVQGAERREGTLKAQSWPATGHRLAQLPAHHTTPVPSVLRCWLRTQQHGLWPEEDPGCLRGDVPRALPEAEGRASEHPSRPGPTPGPPALALSHAAPGQANAGATRGWGTEPPTDLQAGTMFYSAEMFRTSSPETASQETLREPLRAVHKASDIH